MATQSIVAQDLIKRSMYLINALAAGETPDAQSANDALATLNELIDSWSTEALAPYGEVNETFTLVPGQFIYSWGTGGDWSTERPVYVNGATCIRQNVSTNVRIINQEEYDGISIKSTSQPLIEQLLYVNSYPLGTAVLFPVPTEAVTLSIATTRVLTSIPTLNTTILMPPGYIRALRHNLAVELWPEYINATTDITSIRAVAVKAKANIKIANMTDVLSSYGDIPNVDAGRFWDWREG